MFADIKTHHSVSRSKLLSHGTTHQKRGVLDGPIPAGSKIRILLHFPGVDKQKHSQLQVLWEI